MIFNPFWVDGFSHLLIGSTLRPSTTHDMTQELHLGLCKLTFLPLGIKFVDITLQVFGMLHHYHGVH